MGSNPTARDMFQTGDALDVARDILTELDACTQGVTLVRHLDGSVSSVEDALSVLLKRKLHEPYRASVGSIIGDACKRAETMAPGSTPLLVGTLLYIVENGSDESRIKQISDMVSWASGRCVRPSTEVLAQSIDHLDWHDLVLEAIALAGAESRIFLEPSQALLPSVERIHGFSFNCIPDPSFFKDGKWSSTNALCVIIDGVIDHVSEIDTMLTQCNENRRSMVIFARGFSDEVQATLRVNFLRKTLNVIPITVSFALDTANVLNDVAVAVGTDVVSSLKGQLISTLRIDDAAVLRQVIASRSGALINPDRTGNVREHLKMLADKRKAESIPEIRAILDRRIRSLSSSSVVIRYDDSGPAGSHMMQSLDHALKIARSVIRYGALDLGANPDIRRVVGHGPNALVPMLNVSTALRLALTCVASIKSIAGVI